MKKSGLGAFIVVMALPVAMATSAQYPQLLRMKGRFTDTKVPLSETLPVHFSIWDSEDGYGNLLWQDTQGVTVRDSTFEVVLGRSKTLTPSVFSGGDRWVEIQIGTDAPMRPRHKIPNHELQAQVAAVQAVAPPVSVPTPTPVPPVVVPAPVPAPEISEQERKDLELQIEQYKEAAAKKAEKPAKRKPVVHVPETSGPLGSTYEVKPGDTLKSIAQKLYGNAELWYDLYYLNRDRLGPMGHLFPGQILVLPNPATGEHGK